MALPGPAFLELEKRVQALAAKFVDDQAAAEQKDPTTFQPDLDRLAAFRLLVHAEIEEYLEAKARAALAALESKVLAATFSVKQHPEIFEMGVMLDVPMPFECPFVLGNFNSAVKALLRTARKSVDDNNGIKPGSFLTLSVLCGKHIDEVDPSLAGDLEAFGRARGDVAHKSVSRVRTILAPSAELSAAKSLVSGLRTYFY